MSSWRNVFDQVLVTFGGWPSLEASSEPNIRIRIERLYGIMVAKFRADSLFKATVQPDDKNSDRHVLLVRMQGNCILPSQSFVHHSLVRSINLP